MIRSGGPEKEVSNCNEVAYGRTVLEIYGHWALSRVLGIVSVEIVGIRQILLSRWRM
jgi:hypothetical protein